jgi:hypothetical protein
MKLEDKIYDKEDFIKTRVLLQIDELFNEIHCYSDMNLP